MNDAIKKTFSPTVAALALTTFASVANSATTNPDPNLIAVNLDDPSQSIAVPEEKGPRNTTVFFSKTGEDGPVVSVRMEESVEGGPAAVGVMLSYKPTTTHTDVDSPHEPGTFNRNPRAGLDVAKNYFRHPGENGGTFPETVIALEFAPQGPVLASFDGTPANKIHTKLAPSGDAVTIPFASLSGVETLTVAATSPNLHEVVDTFDLTAPNEAALHEAQEFANGVTLVDIENIGAERSFAFYGNKHTGAIPAADTQASLESSNAHQCGNIGESGRPVYKGDVATATNFGVRFPAMKATFQANGEPNKIVIPGVLIAEADPDKSGVYNTQISYAADANSIIGAPESSGCTNMAPPVEMCLDAYDFDPTTGNFNAELSDCAPEQKYIETLETGKSPIIAIVTGGSGGIGGSGGNGGPGGSGGNGGPGGSGGDTFGDIFGDTFITGDCNNFGTIYGDNCPNNGDTPIITNPGGGTSPVPLPASIQFMIGGGLAITALKKKESIAKGAGALRDGFRRTADRGLAKLSQAATKLADTVRHVAQDISDTPGIMRAKAATAKAGRGGLTSDGRAPITASPSTSGLTI